MNAKKIMFFTLLQLFVGLTASQSANADTLSDLKAQCLQCHNYIVSPSGWSLNGTSLGRHPLEKTLSGWLSTISAMGDGMCGFNNIGPGGTPRAVAAQFLYDKQYITPLLTSIAVTPVNHTIKIGESQQFTATGTLGNGASRVLVGGGGTWVGKASMSTMRYVPAVGVVNGTLYVVGGSTGSTPLATVEAYDPATNTWVSKASLSAPRAGHAVGVVNGILYAVGGYDNVGTYLATVEAYDPTTNTWTPRASMPAPREGHAVGVVKGILYAVGGYNGFNYLTTVEAYNPATNTWTPKTSLPTSRFFPGVGVVNDILYAVGGLGASGFLATMDAYDPATNAWTAKAPISTQLYAPATGVVNDTLYVVGGYSSGTLATVASYDPATNAWVSKTAMTTPRYLHAAGVVSGILYAVGGYNDLPGAMATMEAYTPADGIIWSSTTSVATIAQSGVALGVSVGQTLITATSGSISGSTSLAVVGQPDLVITAVSSSVSAIVGGKTFTFSSTTKNQGNGATTTSTSTGLYLSTDATITTADILVGSVSVASLAAGSSQSATTSATLPKTLARGTYYLGAIADYTNAVAESNESNNSLTGTTIQVK